jgi:hypothetical protein
MASPRRFRWEAGFEGGLGGGITWRWRAVRYLSRDNGKPDRNVPGQWAGQE